jgi:predicted RNA binding protein YcfA (HicA-like mRNA interferase family)
MTPRPTRIIKSALTRKGFVHREKGDRQRFRLFVDGERTEVHTRYTGRLRYRTVNSHGARECDDHILRQMAKQLCLSRTQLNDLIDCKMGGDEYVRMLRELGEL